MAKSLGLKRWATPLDHEVSLMINRLYSCNMNFISSIISKYLFIAPLFWAESSGSPGNYVKWHSEHILHSVWIPFIDRVPNDRPFHNFFLFGVDCYYTNVIVYDMCKQTRKLMSWAHPSLLTHHYSSLCAERGRSLGTPVTYWVRR